MFIVYEYAICVLAVSIGATMLFTACAVFLVLFEVSSFLAQRLRKHKDEAMRLQGSRMAIESSVP